MSIKAISLAPIALIAAAPLPAKTTGITIRPGETWIFAIQGGQPVKARLAEARAAPAGGEVKVTIRTLMGTTMTISNNSPQSYTYRAELLVGGKFTGGRSCTLPARGRTSFEHWPSSAGAVRLSDFKPNAKAGNCP